MTQNKPTLLDCLVTDEYRARAEFKYKLKQLESRLCKYLESNFKLEYYPDAINYCCELIAHKYLDYLKLINPDFIVDYSLLIAPDSTIDWSEQYQCILNVKEQLSKSMNLEEKTRLMVELASLYHQTKKVMNFIFAPSKTKEEINHLACELKQLFQTDDLQTWLNAILTLQNKNHGYLDLSLVFQEWTSQEQYHALEIFSEPNRVDLINAIFFYKLYPDKLFTELIHPEKLVSIRVRLGILHNNIETLQSQVMNTAQQFGIKSGVDYLFHGDELPQGILIEVNEEYRVIIQQIIKQVKVIHSIEDEAQVTLDRLHDLGRAYKFWFNPNRLIDAVMVLQQRLVKQESPEEHNLLLFHQEMIVLFGQLTTTECLDLYGYFANNDSRYLLYTLFTIHRGQPMDWLPPLDDAEKLAIMHVFYVLRCVMEALRMELKNRHVTTEPYIHDLAKLHIQSGKRNREAVFRIIAIYGREPVVLSDAVEQLFNSIENN